MILNRIILPYEDFCCRAVNRWGLIKKECRLNRKWTLSSPSLENMLIGSHQKEISSDHQMRGYCCAPSIGSTLGERRNLSGEVIWQVYWALCIQQAKEVVLLLVVDGGDISVWAK